MKIVFVVIGVESLAVEFLSGFLKSCGHEVELVFDPRLFASEAIKVKKLSEYFDTKKELAKEIISKNRILLAFRCLPLITKEVWPWQEKLSC